MAFAVVYIRKASSLWKNVFCEHYHNYLSHHTGLKKSGYYFFKRFFSYKSEGVNIKEIDVEQNANYVSTFQQLMFLRNKQAKCSILLELDKKSDMACVVYECGKFGAIKDLYSYKTISNNVFLLIEFANETSVTQLLAVCQNENVSDAFSAFSRIIRFKPKNERTIPKLTLQVKEDQDTSNSKIKLRSVSDLILHQFENERLSELSIRLRFFLCRLIKESMNGLFPYSEVYPFGSSVNGLGKQGCDLDAVVRLYPARHDKNSEFSFLNKTCVGNLKVLQGTSVLVLGDYLRSFLPGFGSMQKIAHAKVPIVKFKHKLLGLQCDLSINNIAPVLMSEILFFCGEIDSRVRPLISAVKRWAKLSNVTYETPGNWITNFGLVILVVFFLQNRPIPILPKLNDVLKIIGAEFEPVFEIQYLTSLSDLQNKASTNKESLADLLREFLLFLGAHPFKDRHISILTGSDTEKISDSILWVQYPMVENWNVTKNVRQSELNDMCDKAQLSAEYFIRNTKSRSQRQVMDFAHILGLPDIQKYFTHRSKRARP